MGGYGIEHPDRPRMYTHAHRTGPDQIFEETWRAMRYGGDHPQPRGTDTWTLTTDTTDTTDTHDIVGTWRMMYSGPDQRSGNFFDAIIFDDPILHNITTPLCFSKNGAHMLCLHLPFNTSDGFFAPDRTLGYIGPTDHPLRIHTCVAGMRTAVTPGVARRIAEFTEHHITNMGMSHIHLVFLHHLASPSDLQRLAQWLHPWIAPGQLTLAWQPLDSPPPATGWHTESLKFLAATACLHEARRTGAAWVAVHDLDEFWIPDPSTPPLLPYLHHHGFPAACGVHALSNVYLHGPEHELTDDWMGRWYRNGTSTVNNHEYLKSISRTLTTWGAMMHFPISCDVNGRNASTWFSPKLRETQRTLLPLIPFHLYHFMNMLQDRTSMRGGRDRTHPTHQRSEYHAVWFPRIEQTLDAWWSQLTFKLSESI